MEAERKMKLKNPYEIMEVEGIFFAVPMEAEEGDFGGVVKLSKSAAVIFELLQEETSEETIVETLGRRFDAPKGTLVKDVHDTIAKFQKKGLLV